MENMETMETRGLNNWLLYKINAVFYALIFASITIGIAVLAVLINLAGGARAAVMIGVIGMLANIIWFVVVLIKNVVVARARIKAEANK